MFILTDFTDTRMMDAVRANPHAGVRSAASAVAMDAVESMTTRCYGQPIPMRIGRESLLPGGRYFAEDN